MEYIESYRINFLILSELSPIYTTALNHLNNFDSKPVMHRPLPIAIC